MNAILNEYEYDWGYNKGEEVVFGNVTYAINIEARTAGVRHFNNTNRYNPIKCNIPNYITYYGIDYRVNSIPDTAFFKTAFTELSIPETVTHMKICTTPGPYQYERLEFTPSYFIDCLNINPSPCPVDSFGKGYSKYYSRYQNYKVELYSGLPCEKIRRFNIGRDGNYYMGAIRRSLVSNESHTDYGYYSGFVHQCVIDTVVIKDSCTNVKLEVNCGEWDSYLGGVNNFLVEYSDIPLDTLVINNKIINKSLPNQKYCFGRIDRDIKHIEGDIIILELGEHFDTLPSFYYQLEERNTYFRFRSPNLKLTFDDVKGFWGVEINENNTVSDIRTYNWAVYNRERDTLLMACPIAADDGLFHFAPELKSIKRGTIWRGRTGNIAFHDGIEEIEERAFEEYRNGINLCGSLNGAKRIGNNALAETKRYDDELIGETLELLSIEELGDSALLGHKEITTYILGPNAKKIGKHAFGKKMSKYEKPKFPAWEEYIPPVYRICILADEVPECGEIFSRDMFYDEEQADKWHYRNFEFYVPAHMVEKYRNCDQDFRNYPIYDIAQYNAPAGIDEVTDYAPEAAPEYYNLTGTQITNPTPGHLYIVKRGNRVTKELFQGL